MFNIINLIFVDSLMDEIKKYPANTLLTCEEQTKGRGKYNRNWISKRSNNLYMALSIKNDYNNFYCFLSGLAILNSINNKNIKLKWPNDLILNDKKFCGILIEKYENNLIIGIGINIDYFPEDTIFKATSLNNEGIYLSKEILLNNFIKNFENLSNNLNNFSFKSIKNEWLNNAYKINQEIKVSINESENYIGIFNGIDDDGALLLNINNNIKKIYSADIFNI